MFCCCCFPTEATSSLVAGDGVEGAGTIIGMLKLIMESTPLKLI